MFNAIDYVIMGVYLCGIVGLGFYLQKKASSSLQDYFLGGNKLPWWALGVSGMASQLDMTGTMILVSMLFLFGLRGMYIEVRGGLAILMAFAMVFMGKWNRRSGCMTVAEWMEYRFGSNFGGEAARFIQASALLVSTVGMLAYFVKGAGMFLSMFLPWSPVVCAGLMIIIATVYTVVSGFYGVVYTDLFQAGFIICAMLFIAITAFLKIDNAADFESLASTVTYNSDWFSTSLPLSAEMPAGYGSFEKLAFAVFFYFVLVVFVGMSKSGGRPNYFGARNERECGTQTFVWLISSAIRWPMIIGFVVLGMFLVRDMFPDMGAIGQASEIIKHQMPEVQEHNWGQAISQVQRAPGEVSATLGPELSELLGDNWREKLHLVNYHGIVNSEQILPAVIKHVIPAGLKGLILVALIAAAMSTFDSTVNMSAAYFVRDIYQRHIRKDATNKQLVRVSHITCIVVVIAGFILGYSTRSINDIWDWIMVGIGGGIALPGLLRWYWWRFNGLGYAGGVFAGLTAAVVQRLSAPGMPVWHRFPLVVGVSFVVAVIITYLTKPVPREVLNHFYKTTRPFGLWKPLESELDSELRKATRKEHRNDIIALFFAVPWQFLIYWVPVQAVLHEWRNFWVSAGLLAVSSVGLYIFWYKNLPPVGKPVQTQKPSNEGIGINA